MSAYRKLFVITLIVTVWVIVAVFGYRTITSDLPTSIGLTFVDPNRSISFGWLIGRD